ncbi:hypothetical protein PAAG_05885 [Paracoccidioides lutzii Pb01]|uniref:N-glycosylation protein EOS1 n=1 Tax=Paracoccidioides lutzii (strain ATCC MYA-826 / Pb01) TaxID=502779 RepID=C1H544_PARBA|nr:hypothetical protein PAAG_05885 [Paracoccidioides lutzii Pb01]EEH34838.2 hypothetical protein PAAG_05885 [Paracoccidioides lutzii Pb01]
MPGLFLINSSHSKPQSLSFVNILTTTPAIPLISHRNNSYQLSAKIPALVNSRLASSLDRKPLPPPPHHALRPQSQPRFRNSLRPYREHPVAPVDPPPSFSSSIPSPPFTVVSPSTSPSSDTSISTSCDVVSALHPRVAVILGVDRRWHIPLLFCRGLSVLPAAWWGLRCAFMFLAELLRIRPQFWHEGWTAAIVMSTSGDWDMERRFRVIEVALAIIWCSASAYLFYFFTDCMMSRWLLNYAPPAVVIRLLATNGLLAYLTSWILYLSGASSDPRLLLPAWISIASVLSFVYHITQRQINVKKETFATIYVFSIASFISMCSLLLQLHLTRENEPEVPLFVMGKKALEIGTEMIAEYRVGTPCFSQ